MKKIYNNPECDIKNFVMQDVLMFSGTTDGKDDWGISPEW